MFSGLGAYCSNFDPKIIKLVSHLLRARRRFLPTDRPLWGSPNWRTYGSRADGQFGEGPPAEREPPTGGGKVVRRAVGIRTNCPEIHRRGDTGGRRNSTHGAGYSSGDPGDPKLGNSCSREPGPVFCSSPIGRKCSKGVSGPPHRRRCQVSPWFSPRFERGGAGIIFINRRRSQFC